MSRREVFFKAQGTPLVTLKARPTVEPDPMAALTLEAVDAFADSAAQPLRSALDLAGLNSPRAALVADELTGADRWRVRCRRLAVRGGTMTVELADKLDIIGDLAKSIASGAKDGERFGPTLSEIYREAGAGTSGRDAALDEAYARSAKLRK